MPRLDGLGDADDKVHDERVVGVEGDDVAHRQPGAARRRQQREVAHDVHYRVPARLLALEAHVHRCTATPRVTACRTQCLTAAT